MPASTVGGPRRSGEVQGELPPVDNELPLVSCLILAGDASAVDASAASRCLEQLMANGAQRALPPSRRWRQPHPRACAVFFAESQSGGIFRRLPSCTASPHLSARCIQISNKLCCRCNVSWPKEDSRQCKTVSWPLSMVDEKFWRKASS